MNIQALRTFLEIASQNQFARAAVRLNYAQSSVTAQIKALENELGQKLFQRGRKGAELTEAGLRLLPYARQIVDLEVAAKESAQAIPEYTGSVVISTVESISAYRLPPLFKYFQHLAPHAKIEFKTLFDREIYSGLKTGTTDVAFVIEKNVQLDFASVAKIGDEGVSLYVRPDHPLAFYKPSLEELAAYCFLLWGQKGSYIDAFEGLVLEAGFPTLKTIDIINVETIKQCAIEGVGVALLLDICVKKEVESGTLVRVDWEFPQVFSSYLVWNKHKVQSRTVELFITTCREYFYL